MEEIVKYIVLGLLVLPFVALITDALGKTDGVMLHVVFGVAFISAMLAFMIGGLHQRPNVASIFEWAWVAWPFFLLTAKGMNPSLSWSSIWISVPFMSWYLVVLSMQFYYPTSGAGGGMGAGLALIAGWFYMVIPFAILSGIFIAVRAVIRRIKTQSGHRN